MNLINVLSVPQETLDQISVELKPTLDGKKKTTQSTTWVKWVKEYVEDMEFKRSADDPKCFTAYTCLEKIIELSKDEILAKAKEYKDGEDFDEFMQVDIYSRILILMHVLTPEVLKKGKISVNNSISKRYKQMKILFKYIFRGLPNISRLMETVNRTFAKTKDEQKKINKKNSEANKALGFNNTVLSYQQLSSDAHEMYQTFIICMTEYKHNTKAENKILFQTGNQLAVLSSSCRPGAPLRSGFETVPEMYNNRLGSVSPEQSFTTLTEDTKNLPVERQEKLLELRQSLVFQTGVLKKKKSEIGQTDYGSIRIVNFLSVEQFLELIRLLKILFNHLTVNWLENRKIDGDKISAWISDAVPRDAVLLKYQGKLIEKINNVGKQTRTHLWRAIGAAVSVWRLSHEKSKSLFGDNVLNNNQLYAIILSHQEFSQATQAYQYIQVEGLSRTEVVQTLTVSESTLIVELYTKITILEKECQRIAIAEKMNQDLLARITKLEEALQPKKTTDESIAGKFPNDTKKRDDTVQKQAQRDFYNKVVEHLDQEGVTSRSWETIKKLNTGMTRSVIEWIQLESRPNKKQKIDI